VIRNYPEFPTGSRRWDDRVFHPDENGGADRPISTLWKRPPAFVEKILGCIRLLEKAVVQRPLERMFRPSVEDSREQISIEMIAAKVVATEAVSSEALS
jgi:hypothetical protein